MRTCQRCGSSAINPDFHGRDRTNLDLCDVCFWRAKAETFEKRLKKLEAQKPLRLFVWEGFSPDYTGGLAVALAETVEQAKQLVLKDLGENPINNDWGDQIELNLTVPVAFAVNGGG